MTDELEIQEAERKRKATELRGREPAAPEVAPNACVASDGKLVLMTGEIAGHGNYSEVKIDGRCKPYDDPEVRARAALVPAPALIRYCSAQGGTVTPCVPTPRDANKCLHSRWGSDPYWEGPCGCPCHGDL